MSDEINDIGIYEYQLPIWLLVSDLRLKTDDFFDAIPVFFSTANEGYIALFTDREGADEYSDYMRSKNSDNDLIPLKFASTTIVAAILKGFIGINCKYVTIDPKPSKRFYFFDIHDVLSFLEDQEGNQDDLV